MMKLRAVCCLVLFAGFAAHASVHKDNIRASPTATLVTLP